MRSRRFLALLVMLTATTHSAIAAQLAYEVAPTMPLDAAPAAELPSADVIPSQPQTSATTTSNQMLWQQYQALQTGAAPASAECENCWSATGSDYDRCGCSMKLFPWINGPGACDQWCVGPKWGIDAGGLFLFRDNANWAGVIADVAGPDPVLVDQFDHGPGARVFATAYNDAGFGMQVGYEGINDWNASLGYAPDALVADETRSFTYESQLNSLEVNFLRRTDSPWKLFSGFRYVQLDEDFLDAEITDKPIPVPSPAPVSTPFVDESFNRLLKNQLIGLQIGTQRDAWQWGNRLTVNTFANAGVYCNKLRREDVDLTVTTVITGDDLTTPDVNEFSETITTSQTGVRRDFTDIAFVGEAGITAALRLNHCTAVRAGYQILALDGVSQGLDAFLFPNAGLDSSTLVFHGLQFGLEYRR